MTASEATPEDHQQEQDQEQAQGFPCYDKEAVIVQASIGFGCLAYFMFAKD